MRWKPGWVVWQRAGVAPKTRRKLKHYPIPVVLLWMIELGYRDSLDRMLNSLMNTCLEYLTLLTNF
jgi:hypothetical protein